MGGMLLLRDTDAVTLFDVQQKRSLGQLIWLLLPCCQSMLSPLLLENLKCFVQFTRTQGLSQEHGMIVVFLYTLPVTTSSMLLPTEITGSLEHWIFQSI